MQTCPLLCISPLHILNSFVPHAVTLEHSLKAVCLCTFPLNIWILFIIIALSNCLLYINPVNFTSTLLYCFFYTLFFQSFNINHSICTGHKYWCIHYRQLFLPTWYIQLRLCYSAGFSYLDIVQLQSSCEFSDKLNTKENIVLTL